MAVIVDPFGLDLHHRGEEGGGENGFRVGAFEHQGLVNLQGGGLGSIASPCDEWSIRRKSTGMSLENTPPGCKSRCVFGRAFLRKCKLIGRTRARYLRSRPLTEAAYDRSCGENSCCAIRCMDGAGPRWCCIGWGRPSFWPCWV